MTIVLDLLFRPHNEIVTGKALILWRWHYIELYWWHCPLFFVRNSRVLQSLAYFAPNFLFKCRCICIGTGKGWWDCEGDGWDGWDDRKKKKPTLNSLHRIDASVCSVHLHRHHLHVVSVGHLWVHRNCFEAFLEDDPSCRGSILSFDRHCQILSRSSRETVHRTYSNDNSRMCVYVCVCAYSFVENTVYRMNKTGLFSDSVFQSSRVMSVWQTLPLPLLRRTLALG